MRAKGGPRPDEAGLEPPPPKVRATHREAWKCGEHNAGELEVNNLAQCCSGCNCTVCRASMVGGTVRTVSKRALLPVGRHLTTGTEEPVRGFRMKRPQPALNTVAQAANRTRVDTAQSPKCHSEKRNAQHQHHCRNRHTLWPQHSTRKSLAKVRVCAYALGTARVG